MLTETNNGEYVLCRIKKGNTIYATNQIYHLDSGRQQTTMTLSCLFQASANDQITTTVQGGGSSPQYYMDANYGNFMVKMIG
jgi:oxalate decarboxylase/phosphoglucose isomerase-like protein (cupin superfamily)